MHMDTKVSAFTIMIITFVSVTRVSISLHLVVNPVRSSILKKHHILEMWLSINFALKLNVHVKTVSQSNMLKGYETHLSIAALSSTLVGDRLHLSLRTGRVNPALASSITACFCRHL